MVGFNQTLDSLRAETQTNIIDCITSLDIGPWKGDPCIPLNILKSIPYKIIHWQIPGGGVLWYFHIYVGSGHFLGVFRKLFFFGDMKILRIFFLGKIGLYLGVISMHFRVFS